MVFDRFSDLGLRLLKGQPDKRGSDSGRSQRRQRHRARQSEHGALLRPASCGPRQARGEAGNGRHGWLWAKKKRRRFAIGLGSRSAQTGLDEATPESGFVGGASHKQGRGGPRRPQNQNHIGRGACFGDVRRAGAEQLHVASRSR